MNSQHDPSRQDATPTDSVSGPNSGSLDSTYTEPSLDKYTVSVAEAVIAFRQQGMSLTDRTIQRYCHSGKLRALRIDPDTRQVATGENYVFVIDPTSIPERISQIRERKEFTNPTIVATSHDETRQDEPSRDMPRQETQTSDQKRETSEYADELASLREKLNSLEIDKAVRDGLLQQMKEDRGNLLGQLERHVQTMNEQSRQIGSLETKLALSEPLGRVEETSQMLDPEVKNELGSESGAAKQDTHVEALPMRNYDYNGSDGQADITDE